MSGDTQRPSAPAFVEFLYRLLLHIAANARWLWLPGGSRDLVSVLMIYAALFALILYAFYYDVPDSAVVPLSATAAGLQAKLTAIHHRAFGGYNSR